MDSFRRPRAFWEGIAGLRAAREKRSRQPRGLGRLFPTNRAGREKEDLVHPRLGSWRSKSPGRHWVMRSEREGLGTDLKAEAFG